MASQQARLRKVKPFVAQDLRRQYETLDGKYRFRTHGGWPRPGWDGGRQEWVAYEIASGKVVAGPASLTSVRMQIARLQDEA